VFVVSLPIKTAGGTNFLQINVTITTSLRLLAQPRMPVARALFLTPSRTNTIYMEESENILAGYSDQEKGAYLGAIASIATADRSATEEEIEHLCALAQAADLSPTQEAAVVRAAQEISADELKRCLDILNKSKLKFSLIADVITFAKVDKSYTPEEKENIKKIADYLQVDHEQFSLLDQFVNKATTSNADPAEVRKPGFFESLGLRDKFENAGMNVNSLSKGLLGMLGPLVLGSMISGGLRRRGNNMFGQNRMSVPSGGGFGGLGSIFSMLSRGGSYRGTGGLVPRLFR
jgi:uncharacterized tellurite resistance protein B-like protein